MKEKQSYMYKRRYEEEGRRREYVTYGNKRNKVTCTREDMRKKEEEENT